MGREEGGGFRMGNTCIPVADYVKFKNKIKLKKKKKKTKRSCRNRSQRNSLRSGLVVLIRDQTKECRTHLFC